MLHGSITDRRDFYHQAMVTSQRGQSNMLPFAYPLEAFEGTQALEILRDSFAAPASTAREIVGDKLGFSSSTCKSRKKILLPDHVYPCFASLFQGDHLGVEFALRSHSLLLENHGLLDPCRRLLGGVPVPAAFAWEALVIDDYFAISVDRICAPAEQSFSSTALEKSPGSL